MTVYDIRKLGIKESAKILAKELQNGEVCICPTETVYGFSARAFDSLVSQKLAGIKNVRSTNRLYIVLVRDISMAKKYCLWNPLAQKLAKKYWPGPLTIRMKTREGSIALRVSSHSLYKELFKIFPFPIISTSANLSGEEPFQTLKEMKKIFSRRARKPKSIFYEGKIANRAVSTIVDATGQDLKIVRQGVIRI